MKFKKIMALVLSVTLIATVFVFTPTAPAAVAEKSAVKLSPTDDTFISFTEEKLDVSGGDSTTLELGYHSDSPMPVDTGYGGNSRGDLFYARDMLMKFDLAEIDPNTISSAILKLTISKAKNISSSKLWAVNVAAFDVSDDWTEADATWNTAPAAGVLAAVSDTVSDLNCSADNTVKIDLTSYIRQNPKAVYSFRLKASAGGFDFHSKESGTASARPVLEIEYDGQLASSQFASLPLLADTYTEDSDANSDWPLDGSDKLIFAADKTVDEKNGSLYTRNGFLKIQLPKAGDNTHYDSVKIILRNYDVANADQTLSLVPLEDKEWDAYDLTWENAPVIEGNAAASVTVPNSNSSRLNYFAFDISDYVNSNPSDDGIYAFAVTANTAKTQFYASESKVEAFRPRVECIYRENASLTLHYADPELNDISAESTVMIPEGQYYSPSDYPMVINDEYYYSSEATAEKNAFPYVVKKGVNHVYLIYENKSIEGFEEISVTTIQYEKPRLPEEIQVMFQGGSNEYFPVTWAEIDPDSYAQSGSFAVMGTLQGIQAKAITAQVTVLGITGVNVPTLSTAPGSYPALPSTLSVNLEDGSSRELEVEWNEVPAESYMEVGSFVASGVITLSGMPVQMTVLVEEGTIDDRTALADAYTMETEPNSVHDENPLRISGISSSNPNASARSNRKLFLRFKGSDFGEVYHDPERDADIDPIVSSKVRLYFQSIANSATVTYKIYGIPAELDSWDEESITWNNSEIITNAGEYISSVSIKQSTFEQSWVEFDVTGFVRDNRDKEYLSFYIESNLCAAEISSKDTAGQEPTLRTVGYIPDAPVTLRYMAEVNGAMTDIAQPLALTGKLGNPFEYQSSIPTPIYYPEIDPDGIYYYDFATQPSSDDGDSPSEVKDPALSIESLKESGNELIAKYVRRDIVSINSVDAQSYQGVKPTLPDTVTATLDNGAEITENVVWDWDSISFPDYSTKGVFTVNGRIEHSDIPAKASCRVYQAYYSDPSYQTMNEFDIEADTTYRLSFEIQDVENIASSFIDEIYIIDGSRRKLAYDMKSSQFLNYLSSFNNGDTVELFFTTPSSNNTMTLSLPDCVKHITNSELRQVLGRGGDLTVYYTCDGNIVYQQGVNISFGETFTLPEEYFTVLDGAYLVNGVDAERSIISSLTESITANEENDGKEIYLTCRRSTAFTISASVENAYDYNYDPYTRSTVKIYNGTATDRSASVIISRFNSDGTLESVTVKKLDAPSGEEQAISSTDITAVSDGSYTTLLIWNSVSGLIPFESKIDSRNPTGQSKRPETGDYILVPAMSRQVKASDEQSGNEAVNMLTRDLTTRWSAQVTNGGYVYSDIDLGGVYNVHTVGLGFYLGKNRQTRFSVEASEDGETFTAVINPRYSSGKTNSIEYFTFEPVDARYIRIKGYGWKANEITDEGLVENAGDWFSVTAFEAYGPQVGGPACEVVDFEGLSGKLTAEGSASTDYWGADALNEMSYTDYTPATGGSLYAEIAATPAVDGFEEGSALRLYDNADRDGQDGAGSVGAYRKLNVTSDKYQLRFKWYVPNTIEDETYNAQWSGLALSSGRLKGGADTSNPVALQLRLSPSGKKKMSFNIMRSITYNEGSQASLLGSTSAFNANCVWDVLLDVDAASNSIVVTVSDGTRTESAFVRYNLYNSERTMSQTWSNNSVNYIMFNTGAGGKCEMYVDDLTITPIEDENENAGTEVFSQDYDSASAGTTVRDEEICDTTSGLIYESGQDYTPSYGTMLDVSIDSQSMTGGKALHLQDYVARDNDSVKGAGGVFAYVDLPELDSENITKISFDMYAPTAGEYSGFALGHGHNNGGNDQTNPLALQARFSPQSEGMQFNSYSSIQYNKGSASAMVGTGSNRLSYNAVWHFDLSVNPKLNNITVKATDGSKTTSKTVSIPTSGQDGWTTNWNDNPIDTLIFNTGAGSSSEIFIDNISVVNTGVTKTSLSAVNGLVRYENEYGTGSGSKEGSFLNHNGKDGYSINISKATNPYYTRFVERKGLADPDSVSIEVIGMPNHYLVPVTSGSGAMVTIMEYSDTDSFRQRATFNKVNNLCGAGSTAYSYQWYVNPELYLRNDGNQLKLSTAGGDGVNKACTFHLRNEANNYVSDSFSGTSLSSQWYKGYPWYANYHNHSAVSRSENIIVENGRLFLKATKRGDNEWIKNSSGATGYSDSINNNTWKRYVAWTGVVSVNSKVFNKGSYIEGSFKQPNSPRGYWTAFWLNGRDSWPPETDMFEYLSSKGTSTWYTATHGGTEGAGWMSSSAVGNLRTQYHTFAIDWGYDYMRMYVNGQLYFTAPDTSYQKNMYLILNTGIGAWESEPDSTTVWGQGLECEWIRSYQYY